MAPRRSVKITSPEKRVPTAAEKLPGRRQKKTNPLKVPDIITISIPCTRTSLDVPDNEKRLDINTKIALANEVVRAQLLKEPIEARPAPKTRGRKKSEVVSEYFNGPSTSTTEKKGTQTSTEKKSDRKAPPVLRSSLTRKRQADSTVQKPKIKRQRLTKPVAVKEEKITETPVEQNILQLPAPTELIVEKKEEIHNEEDKVSSPPKKIVRQRKKRNNIGKEVPRPQSPILQTRNSQQPKSITGAKKSPKLQQITAPNPTEISPKPPEKSPKPPAKKSPKPPQKKPKPPVVRSPRKQRSRVESPKPESPYITTIKKENDSDIVIKKNNVAPIESRKTSISSNSNLSWTRDISSSSATTLVTVTSNDFVRFNKKIPVICLTNIDKEFDKYKTTPPTAENNKSTSSSDDSSSSETGTETTSEVPKSDDRSLSFDSPNKTKSLNLSLSSPNSNVTEINSQPDLNKRDYRQDALNLKHALQKLDKEFSAWLPEGFVASDLNCIKDKLVEILSNEFRALAYCKKLQGISKLNGSVNINGEKDKVNESEVATVNQSHDNNKNDMLNEYDIIANEIEERCEVERSKNVSLDSNKNSIVECNKNNSLERVKFVCHNDNRNAVDNNEVNTNKVERVKSSIFARNKDQNNVGEQTVEANNKINKFENIRIEINRGGTKKIEYNPVENKKPEQNARETKKVEYKPVETKKTERPPDENNTFKPKHVESTPNKVHERTPNKVIERTPNNVVERTPNFVVERTPNNVVERTANFVVERTPNNVVERTTNNVVERKSDDEFVRPSTSGIISRKSDHRTPRTPSPKFSSESEDSSSEGEDFSKDVDVNNFPSSPYDDDDALSLFAESITGIESSRINTSNVSTAPVETQFEEYVPKPIQAKFVSPTNYTYCPTKISEQNKNGIVKTVCEKQNADSTSICKDKEVVTAPPDPGNNVENNVDEEGIITEVNIPKNNKIGLIEELFPLEQRTNFIFKGYCFNNMLKKCPAAMYNLPCRYDHSIPNDTHVKTKLRILNEYTFIQEYILVRRNRHLMRLYGMCFVSECVRRQLTRVLVEMAYDFIARGQEGFTLDETLKVAVVEITLLYLNNVDLSECEDLLKLKYKDSLLCELFMQIMTSTQNFSRFRSVFLSLTYFMVNNDRTFKLEVAEQILERVCILPFEESLAKAVLQIIRLTSPEIFLNKNIVHFEKTISANKGVLEEYMSLKKEIHFESLVRQTVSQRPIQKVEVPKVNTMEPRFPPGEPVVIPSFPPPMIMMPMDKPPGVRPNVREGVPLPPSPDTTHLDQMKTAEDTALPKITRTIWSHNSTPPSHLANMSPNSSNSEEIVHNNWKNRSIFQQIRRGGFSSPRHYMRPPLRPRPPIRPMRKPHFNDRLVTFGGSPIMYPPPGPDF